VTWLLERLLVSAAPLEVVWACLGLFGTGMGVGIVWTWLRWYWALARTGLSARHNFQAATHLVTHLLVLAMHVVILVIGIVAVLMPPADPDKVRAVTVVGVVLTVGLFTIAVLALLVQGWLVLRWGQLRRIMQTSGG
jgi:hypothetical protein